MFDDAVELLTELENVVYSEGRQWKSKGPSGARAMVCSAWTIRTFRLSFAVRRLLEASMPTEATPINRSAFEHAIRVLAVAKTDLGDGELLRVLDRLDAIEMKKLRGTYGIEEFTDLDHVLANEIEIPEHPSDEAKQLFNRLKYVEQTLIELDLRHWYVMYRHDSALSHPSRHTAMLHWEKAPLSLQLQPTEQPRTFMSPVIWCKIALDGLDLILDLDEPLKAWSNRAGERLEQMEAEIPEAEAVEQRSGFGDV